MTPVNRRQTLYLAGAGMAALAGCSDSDSDSDSDDETAETESTIDADGELPSYAAILPENDQSAYFYGAIDIDTMVSLIDDGDAEAGEEPTDPLVGNPVVVALLSSFGLTLLADSPASEAYSRHDETPGGEGQLVYADGVYAIVGSFDRAGLADGLEAAGYDLLESEATHAVYTDPDTDEVVGVTDDVYAFSYPNADDPDFEPAAAVERTVETAVGDRQPKHETDDDFAWLLRAGATDGITMGLYTEAEAFDAATLERDQPDDDADDLEFDFTPFEDAGGVHQRLAVAGDDAQASAIITYADADRVALDRLESSLGTEADSVDVVQDDAVVSIEAEYGGDLS